MLKYIVQNFLRSNKIDKEVISKIGDKKKTLFKNQSQNGTYTKVKVSHGGTRLQSHHSW